MNSAINLRYSELAESSCCLSCGGAINHSKVSEGETCVDLGSGRGTDVLRMAESVGSEGYVYGEMIPFLKIFRQGNKELAANLDITGSPTVIFYENGKIV